MKIFFLLLIFLVASVEAKVYLVKTSLSTTEDNVEVLEKTQVSQLKTDGYNSLFIYLGKKTISKYATTYKIASNSEVVDPTYEFVEVEFDYDVKKLNEMYSGLNIIVNSQDNDFALQIPDKKTFSVSEFKFALTRADLHECLRQDKTIKTDTGLSLSITAGNHYNQVVLKFLDEQNQNSSILKYNTAALPSELITNHEFGIVLESKQKKPGFVSFGDAIKAFLPWNQSDKNGNPTNYSEAYNCGSHKGYCRKQLKNSMAKLEEISSDIEDKDLLGCSLYLHQQVLNSL